MANLFTKHDPYNIHKLLGIASLLNYLLRFYYLFAYGSAFPQHEEPIKAIFCVLLHGALSTSSLLLPLPLKRNFSSPMIWPEFRLHSITFALRHVIATALTIPNTQLNPIFTHVWLRLGLIVFTLKCASLITEKFGEQERRTTNTMPYPRWISYDMQRSVKDMYTRAQFGATKSIVLGDPTMSYFPLFAIQMAPLLMTLVRKGKIACITYHRFYAISLTASYVAFFIRLCAQPDKHIIVSLIVSALFPLSNLRRNGISRYTIWTFYALFHFILAPMVQHYFSMPSVVIVCGVVILVSGANSSSGSINSRLLCVLSVILILMVKLICFGDTFDFETEGFELQVLKLFPFMVMYAILQELRSYKCLFIINDK